MIDIHLPWPDKALSPNARVHWSKLGKAKANYKANTWLICGRFGGLKTKLLERGGAIRLRVTFCPPDKRRRDRDNMIASFKAGQDGIAAALGIDDNHFVVTYAVAHLPDFAGVRVKLEPAE